MSGLFNGLKSWALALVTAMASILGAYFYGVSVAKRKADEERQEDYIDTRKRIDEADGFDHPDAAREWLRNRDQ